MSSGRELQFQQAEAGAVGEAALGTLGTVSTLISGGGDFTSPTAAFTGCTSFKAANCTLKNAKLDVEEVSTECSAWPRDPKALVSKMQKIQKNADLVIKDVACKVKKRDEALSMLTCLDQDSKKVLSEIAKSSELARKDMATATQEIQKYKSEITNCDDQLKDADDALNGPKGLVAAQKSVEATLGAIDAQINTLNTRSQTAKKQKAILENQKKVRKASYAINCFRNDAAGPKAISPAAGKAANEPAAYGAYDYGIHLYTQYRLEGKSKNPGERKKVLGSERYDPNTAAGRWTQDPGLGGEAAALRAQFDILFPPNVNVDDALPGGADGKSTTNAMPKLTNYILSIDELKKSAAYRALTAYKTPRHAGWSYSNMAEFVEAKYKSCSTSADNKVLKESKTDGHPLKDLADMVSSLSDASKADPSAPAGNTPHQIFDTITPVWSDANDAIKSHMSKGGSDTQIPFDASKFDQSGCKSSNIDSVSACFERFKVSMKGMLGTSATGIEPAIVAIQGSLRPVNVSCFGLKGCISKVQDAMKQIKQVKTKTEAAKTQKVSEFNSKADQKMAGMKTQVGLASDAMNKKVSMINAALQAIGGKSMISFESIEADDLEKDDDGLYKMPKDFSKYVGGNSTPPMLDLNSKSLGDSRTVISETSDVLDELQKKATAVKSGADTVASTCVGKKVEDLSKAVGDLSAAWIAKCSDTQKCSDLLSRGTSLGSLANLIDDLNEVTGGFLDANPLASLESTGCAADPISIKALEDKKAQIMSTDTTCTTAPCMDKEKEIKNQKALETSCEQQYQGLKTKGDQLKNATENANDAGEVK